MPYIFASIIILFCLVLGVALVAFARKIGESTFFELIPGVGIPEFIEKFILRRKPKEDERLGIFMYKIFIRIFGFIIIIFSIFMTYTVFFSK